MPNAKQQTHKSHTQASLFQYQEEEQQHQQQQDAQSSSYPPIMLMSPEQTTAQAIQQQEQPGDQQNDGNKSRKVYIITERGSTSSTSTSTAKLMPNRHIYLVMEEDADTEQPEDKEIDHNEIFMKSPYNNGNEKQQQNQEHGLKLNEFKTKRVILFANKSDVNITKRVEQYLPEILGYIQAKEANPNQQQQPPTIQRTPTPVHIHTNKHMISNMNVIQTPTMQRNAINNSYKRARITLPPKKLLSKYSHEDILYNSYNKNLNNYVENFDIDANKIGESLLERNYSGEEAKGQESVIKLETSYEFNNINTHTTSAVKHPIIYNNIDHDKHVQAENATTSTFTNTLCAATPVIVTPARLLSKMNNKNKLCTMSNNLLQENNSNHVISTSNYNTNKNNITMPSVKSDLSEASGISGTTKSCINLTPDFLFFMRLLPKLESIPEPHKTRVKTCVEKLIMQNSLQ